MAASSSGLKSIQEYLFDSVEPSAILNVGGLQIQDNVKQKSLAAPLYHYAIFNSTCTGSERISHNKSYF